MLRFACWALLCATLPLCYGQKNYTSHKLIGVYASSEKELDVLKTIREENEADFWTEPAKIFEKVSILVPPQISQKLEDKLYANGIDFFVYNNNIQELINKEQEENILTERESWPFKLDVYYPLNEIIRFTDILSSQHSNLTSIITLGKSAEGNDIRGIKVSSGGAGKPAIWIDAGIHAREWIAPATALYVLMQLTTMYNSSAEIKDLVDTFDWYILPMVNPDGYLYTWTQDRMWRKNRSPSNNALTQCRGVDPNRNFDAHFGGAGTSDDQCSEIYRGRGPFSEPESQAIRDGVLQIRNQLKAYITIHSFSQLWLCPYGHSVSRPDNYSEMKRALDVVVGAIYSKHYQWYRAGSISNVIYRAAGSSVDWVYDTVGVKYSFVVELRDKGHYGFLLPKSQIIPTSEENFEGIKALARHIKNEL